MFKEQDLAITGTFKWYRAGLVAFLSGDIDYLNDTIKVALTTSSYTPDQDAHDFFDDVTNEVTGTGYTAGGVALGTKSIGTAAGCIARLIAADPAWADSTIANVRTAVVYKDTGAAGTSTLIGYCTYDANGSSTSNTMTLDFDAANGFLTQDGA